MQHQNQQQHAPRKVVVTAQLGEVVDEDVVEFVGAAPPDFRASFSGSALPFANPIQAFENTPTRGTVKVDSSRRFEVEILEPNSFYTDMGTMLVGPSLFVRYDSQGKKRMDRVILGEPIAYRSLTYPNNDAQRARTGPEFYLPGVVVDYPRTQEEIFLDGVYTEKCSDGFWGKRPPL